MKLKHFTTPLAVLDFVFDELLDTLQDDLGNMEGDEAEHYNDADRETMRAKIADIEAIRDHVEVTR